MKPGNELLSNAGNFTRRILETTASIGVAYLALKGFEAEFDVSIPDRLEVPLSVVAGTLPVNIKYVKNQSSRG